MTYWYIAFYDASGTLGGTVVEANDSDHAVVVAKEKGLHPGGEAAVIEVPAQAQNAPDIVALIDRFADFGELNDRGALRREQVTPYGNARLFRDNCDCPPPDESETVDEDGNKRPGTGFMGAVCNCQNNAGFSCEVCA